MPSDPDLIDDPQLLGVNKKVGRFAESKHGVRWLGRWRVLDVRG